MVTLHRDEQVPKLRKGGQKVFSLFSDTSTVQPTAMSRTSHGVARTVHFTDDPSSRRLPLRWANRGLED